MGALLRPALLALPNVLREIARAHPRPSGESIRGDIARGTVFVFRGALQETGCFDELHQASIEGVRHAAGDEAAAEVDAAGFEHLHECVSDDALTAVLASATAAHRRIARAMARRICRHLFGNRAFYLEDRANVRFHVPYDCTRTVRNIEDFQFRGKIVPHGPHKDSWYYCPTNCIDVWMALGPVRKGNGLSIFPEAFGRGFRYNHRGVIARDQSFGRPLNFCLDPGDVLVFSGEHLHSSEINSTQLTRHVVSFRITLERPIFIGNSPYRHNYGLVLPSSGRLAAMVERGHLLLRKVSASLKARFGLLNQSRWIVSQQELDRFRPSSDDTTSERRPRSAHSGDAWPISKTQCAAQAEDGTVYTLRRFCPHQGADLALGHVEGFNLHCPWHNLPIDLRTGRSPCRSIRPVRIASQCANLRNRRRS